MADFTPEQIFSSASVNGSRVSPARNEILRLLEANLPGAIGYQNEREGCAIPEPKGYYTARTSLDGLDGLPVIFVGSDLNFDTKVPRVNFGTITMGIYCIGKRLEVNEDSDNLWDLAQVIALVMKQTQAGWKLPDGRCVWRECVPTNLSDQPTPWQQNSGVALHYEIKQQGLNLWTPAA